MHKIIRSMRDWGRDCICESGQDNRCGHRFDGQYGELPKGYDHKYVYSHLGYNLKATDLQAAVGCAQVKKIDGFSKARRANFETMTELLAGTKEQLILPQKTVHANPSWFGYPITCKEGVDREKLVRHLEDAGIQTRMLFAGNMLKHPCFDQMREERCGYRVVGELTNTDMIMERTFWVGVYPGMTQEKLVRMASEIKEAIAWIQDKESKN